MAVESGVKKLISRGHEIARALSTNAALRVMVGVPGDYNERRGSDSSITNAALAYIHEHGAPEANVPARPFLEPTIKRMRDEISGRLRTAGRFALAGNERDVINTYEALGLRAQVEVQNTIVAGIPPPLAASTVRGRIARRQSQSWRQKRRAVVAANVAAGNAPGSGLFTPLIDTGDLLSSISYVVRRRMSKQNIRLGPRKRGPGA